MLPDEACTSLSVDNILLMMMNTKTFTKPMVVISDNTPVTVKVPEDIFTKHQGKDHKSIQHPTFRHVLKVQFFQIIIFFFVCFANLSQFVLMNLISEPLSLRYSDAHLAVSGVYGASWENVCV